MKYIEDLRRNLMKDIEDSRTRNDQLTVDNERLTTELEAALKRAHLAEQQLKELKSQRDDFQFVLVVSKDFLSLESRKMIFHATCLKFATSMRVKLKISLIWSRAALETRTSWTSSSSLLMTLKDR